MSAVDAWLDDQRSAQIVFLQDLIRTPSTHPPGDLRGAAETTARLLEGLGFTVERHRVPAARLDGTGAGSITNLIVRERFGDGPVVALNAYGDTVPAGDGWSKPPFAGTVEDGWLYGRGAAVDKSDIAAFAFALAALKTTGAPVRGTVELHVTWDGEAAGGCGVKWLLEEGLSKPTHAIAGGFSHTVVTSVAGCVQMEVEIFGRAAHAGLPGIGIDALEAAHRLLGALYEMRSGYGQQVSAVPGIGSPQLTINMIEGGTNPNLLPERVRLRLDRRIIPEEALAEVERNLTQHIEATLGRLPGIDHEVRTLLRAEPLRETPSSAALGEVLVQHASDVLGEPVERFGLPFYSEARHYAGQGIPTAHFGAGPHTLDEARAHRADERVPLAELHAATRIVARALLHLLAQD